MARKTYKDSGTFVQAGGAAIYSPRCPECQAGIQLQATVEKFMDTPKWLFYGEKGKRVIVCKGMYMGFEFTHFCCALKNGHSHRIAWIQGNE